MVLDGLQRGENLSEDEDEDKEALSQQHRGPLFSPIQPYESTQPRQSSSYGESGLR